MKPDQFIQSQLNELECMEDCNREGLLHELKDNQNRIKLNGNLYYDQKQDDFWIEHYYRNIKLSEFTPSQLFQELHQLTARAHKFKQPYYISKDQYLYTWVDLHVDGSLKSIYSGEQKNPIKAMEEDYKTIQKRFELYQKFLEKDRFLVEEIEQQIMNISKQYRFNAEHVVPQSWFQSQEPMKGDLHHLFACDPDCNNARSNFPYFEFDWKSEGNSIHFKDHCGTYGIEHFEPEHGKGAVARASLYFLIRYPGEILKKFRRKMDISLLKRWHDQFPVSHYEKHRNQAIFEIQGNRNPFIDFPELTEKVGFMLDL